MGHLPTHQAQEGARRPGSGHEPIAITGLGLRLAGGVRSVDDLWRVITRQEGLVGDVPEARFAPYAAVSPAHAAAVRDTWRRGAYLDDVEGFDAAFFGISPREAESMDPQHRLLLEVAWEALEDACTPPSRLAGRNVGVYVGIGPSDYGRLLLEDLPGMEPWNGIGAAACAAANRISYALDLRGPSLAVDTACSASLMAVHLGCQALNAGEVESALVGGVNVATAPGPTLTLQLAGALSPDGRSRPFDERANGYGRGEGAAVLVLKRLTDARRDGDRVLGLIRATGAAQDGRTNGIMEPSADAQVALLRRTYRDSGVRPGSIGYVEAHGTGTRAGDPVEARALAEVLGVGRSSGDPCLIGAVKSHVGHLEAGAGVVGVVAAVLALGRHIRVPPRGPVEPNRAIPWGDNGLRLPRHLTPWPAPPDGPRRAAVSGFGYGGTICHVVLEEALSDREPAADRASRFGEDDPAARLWTVSGRDPRSVRETCGALADWLRGDGSHVAIDDVAHTLLHGREHLPSRAAVGARDRDELIAGLDAVAQERKAPGFAVGQAHESGGRGAVWVFSGHGSQWRGMGAGLLEDSAFAATMERLDPVFREESGFSVVDALAQGDPLTEVGRIQHLIFAVQVGVAATLRAHGARPAAVIGHSVGEIAAAVTAGALSLDDGARLICRRCALISPCGGTGAMAMVDLPFADVEQLFPGHPEIAAAIEPSPGTTVVSGSPREVARAVQRWRAEGRAVREVASDTPFHSPAMAALMDPLRFAAADLSVAPAALPMYSTTRDPRRRHLMDGRYWAENLRNPVRLTDAVEAAAEDGYRAFVEIAPHPVVSHSVAETLDSVGARPALVQPVLRRNEAEYPRLMSAVAALYCAGVPLDTGRLVRGGTLRALPSRRWRHRPFWRACAPVEVSSGRLHAAESHSLLGKRDTVPGTTTWRTRLDDRSKPYPGDHRVRGTEVVPAAVIANTLLHAAEEHGGSRRAALRSVDFKVPLTPHPAREVLVSGSTTGLRVSSRLPGTSDAPDRWLTHATAQVAESDLDREADGRSLGGLGERLPDGTVLRLLRDRGVDGIAFSWTIEELHRGADGTVRAHATLGPEGTRPDRACALDLALTLTVVLHEGDPRLRMPSRAERISLSSAVPRQIEVVVGGAASGRPGNARVTLYDLDGQLLGRIDELRCDPVEPEDTADIPEVVHTLRWRVAPPQPPSSPVTRVTVVGDDPVVREVVETLSRFGVECGTAPAPEALRPPGPQAGRTAVVVAPPTQTTADPADLALATSTLLTRTIGRVARWPAAVRPGVWAMTHGVRTSGREDSTGQAALWGMAHVAREEEPETWRGLIDLTPQDPDGPGRAAILHQLLSQPEGTEPLVAVESGRILLPRLTTSDVSRPSRAGLSCSPDGTYLITGGLGALGTETASWLAERGARRLILTSRGGLPPRTRWDDVTDPALRTRIAAVRHLEQLGLSVHVVAADVADFDRCATSLDTERLGLPPIRGVVHAAGTGEGRLLRETSADALRRALRPKVGGAVVLHRLFPPGSLDFFALFSSCGYLLGIPGQAAYGAANACLDALARHRAHSGEETLSLAWTSWKALGMGDNEAVEAELRSRSTGVLSAPQAFAAWDYAVARTDGPCRVVMPLRELPPTRTPPPLLAELTFPASTPATGPDQATPFADLAGAELRDRLRDTVRTAVAKVTGIPDGELDEHRPLPEYGIDSVMSTAVVNEVGRTTGLPLSTAVIWRHPTVSALAVFVADQLRPAEDVHA
ncbi:type I polyketide synthase [Actinosynnema sp. NPDC023794]